MLSFYTLSSNRVKNHCRLPRDSTMQKFIILASEDDFRIYRSLTLNWKVVEGLWLGLEEGAVLPEQINRQHFRHRNPAEALSWTKRNGVIVTNWLPWLVAALPELRPNLLALDLWVETKSDTYPFDFLKGLNRIPCFSEFFVSSRGIEIKPMPIAVPFVSDERRALESFRQTLESTMPSGQDVAVAISGGVDSALVAALLKERGNTLTGFTMASQTPGTNERVHVRQTCTGLNIPLHEFDIDDMPVLLAGGTWEWFWGPQQMPTEVHESEFFAFIKSFGFKHVWTGFGGDQLMFANDWTKLALGGVGAPDWKRVLFSLKEPRIETSRQIFSSHSWDLAARNVKRLEVFHGIEIISPFLEPSVVDLIQQVRPEILFDFNQDKPLIRKTLSDLLGNHISDKPRTGTMTASIKRRLFEIHGIEISQPYVRNWRAISKNQWNNHMDDQVNKSEKSGLEAPQLIHLGKVREVIKGTGSSGFDSLADGCGSPGTQSEPDELC